MTADDFRRLALALHDAVEGAHMGHPDFRVRGRIFATLRPDDSRGMVKLAPGEQQELLREYPAMFVPSSGAWGRQGCTDVKLDAADEPAVRGALVLAWERVAAGPPATARRRAAAGPAALRAQRPRGRTRSG